MADIGDLGRYGFEVFMLDAKRKIAIALTILGTGFCILLFAFNVEQLWIVWLLTVGFFAGSSLSPRMTPIALAVCLMAPTSIVMTIIARSLPLYSLHWSGADTIEIATLAEDWKIVITDQTEINSVMGFGAAGHYESIVKCGNSLHLYVTHGNTKTGYYIHGDTVGPRPGGFSQTVFVPQLKGLRNRLEDLIASKGHSKDSP